MSQCGLPWLQGNGLLKVYDLETRSPESDVKVVDSYHRKAPRLVGASCSNHSSMSCVCALVVDSAVGLCCCALVCE